MTFEDILDQAIAMLQRRGRLTYRTPQRQFQLDAAALEDLALGHLPEDGDTRGLAIDLHIALDRSLNALGEYGRCLALLGEAEGLAFCRASGNWANLRPIAASLGYATALQGRLAEGCALLGGGGQRKYPHGRAAR
jgi:hypothetical protein